jgi:hypothetical protein
MSKSWFALAFLPALAACAATTPNAQVAEKQCTNVQQDSIESKIKVKTECSTPAEGSSVNDLQSDSKPAPQ